MRYLLLAVPFALFGCERDLEYDVQSADPQLVVNSIVAQDSLWSIEVSTTGNPTGDGQILSLKHAQIQLTENSMPITDFVLDSVNARPVFLQGVGGGRGGTIKLYYHRTQQTRCAAGRDYLLRVSHSGYPTVYSTAIVPRSPRVHLLSSPGFAVQINGVGHTRIRFTLDDDGSQTNYYGLEIWAKTPEHPEGLVRVPFYSSEKSFAENYLVTEESSSSMVKYTTDQGVFFTNGKFGNTSAKALELYLESDLLVNADELYIKVLRLSPELFRFAVTYQLQRQNQGNFFAEPTQVYSNIQNGTGIFGGYSVAQLQVR